MRHAHICSLEKDALVPRALGNFGQTSGPGPAASSVYPDLIYDTGARTFASKQAVRASGRGEYHDKTQNKENFVKSLNYRKSAAVRIFERSSPAAKEK